MMQPEQTNTVGWGECAGLSLCRNPPKKEGRQHQGASPFYIGFVHLIDFCLLIFIYVDTQCCFGVAQGGITFACHISITPFFSVQR